MMRDRFTIDHRMSFASYLALSAKRLIRGAADPFVSRFDSDLTSVFVVGCGHSGTTLVAGKISRLSGCYCASWETNAFHPDVGLYWSKAVYGTLMQVARGTGASVLVEKTPKHVHCQMRILRLVPAARFIVVVRNPLDTCASLFRRFGSLDFAIERWNMDNAAALEVAAAPSSKLVRYEELVSNPQVEFSSIASFSGLSWFAEAAEGGVTAFRADDSAGPNMILRSRQVAQPIEARVDVWRGVLTTAMADEVTARTRRVAAALGY
jgi:hypothetical protein